MKILCVGGLKYFLFHPSYVSNSRIIPLKHFLETFVPFRNEVISMINWKNQSIILFSLAEL